MERLAELREGRALTLRDLAERSGVDANTINQVELGHRKPRPSTLRKLARALDVAPEELTGEAVRPKAPAPPPPNDGERGSKKAADALAFLLESKASWGRDLVDELRSSVGEFPLGLDEFIWESGALGAVLDAQPHEVREAPRVRAAKEELKDAQSRLDPLVRQLIGPGELSPEQWEDREKFGRAWSETQRSWEAGGGADIANEADAS